LVKLFQDSCFNILEQLISEGIMVDAIITDPPYNIGYTSWDSDFDLFRAFDLCKLLIKDSGNLIIFQGYSNVCETKTWLDKNFKFQNWIIYDRIKGRGGTRNLTSTREDILWYSNGNNYTFNKMYSNTLKATRGKGLGGKNGQQYRSLSNVWSDISPVVPWSDERSGHPTQKSVSLMKRCVSLWTNKGETVLDFTMGSGSTGVACKELSRSFIGVEIDEHWFNIAKQRIDSVKVTKNLFDGGNNN